MTPDSPTARSYPPKPTDVYLFATCLIDQFAPEAGLDTVRLLEREGITVHYPEAQTCCGQPAYSSGYPQEARAVALQQLQLFSQPWPVVVPSGSCGGMIRHHYTALFADDPALLAQARDLAERTYELSEFLVQVVDFQQADQGAPCTVALHTSCHARRQMGSHDTSAALLDSLAQVKVVVQARIEECCGFGGTFAIRYPDISQAIVSDKVAAIKDSGAASVVSADCGCLFNITGRAARQDELAGITPPTLPGEHLATFLWRRTNGAADMSARESILGRLRATPIDALPALPDVQGWFATHTRSESTPQRVARLRAALEAVHTEVHETSHADWAALLVQILAAKGLRKLLIGQGTAHGAALQALAPPELQLVPYTQPIEQWRDTLFDDMPAALTLARSAVVETGSLIVWPSRAEPRLMSLVPPVHCVLLDADTLHADLNTALRAEGWAKGLPTNALLISGPSKTADIQQTLAYGAHGPRELVVLIRHTQGAAA